MAKTQPVKQTSGKNKVGDIEKKGSSKNRRKTKKTAQGNSRNTKYKSKNQRRLRGC